MASLTTDGTDAAIGGTRRVLITISVMLATIMQAIDMTIANVALPNMQGSLATTQDQIAWVLTSYIVTAAIMMPPTGFLAGRFGRKRLFVIAVIGFTATSMMCGYADSLSEMVFYRILQGGFGAFLVPLSQAVLLDSYPPEQHSGFIVLRVSRRGKRHIMEVLERVVPLLENEALAKQLWVVDEQSIRIRGKEEKDS